MFDKKNANWKKIHPAKFLGMGLMIVLFLAAISGVIMWLWNAILPDVAGVKPISFWQALGLFVLFKILFGGFRRGGRHKSRRKKWKEKWMNMTDEERDEFKSKWKERCNKRGK